MPEVCWSPKHRKKLNETSFLQRKIKRASVPARCNVAAQPTCSHFQRFPMPNTRHPNADAAMQYMAGGVPTVIFAGEEYGTGSSRDWAAKGTQLLGIKAVVARSFERIHRSNLVGMGVLPLQFKGTDSWQSLGLTGNEVVDVIPDASLTPQSDATLRITRANGSTQDVTLTLRVDTPIEVDYYRAGGILPFVLRQLLA